jgi:hypothetical protein
MTSPWRIKMIMWVNSNTPAGHAIQRTHTDDQANVRVEQFVADGKNLFTREQADQILVDLL